MLDFIQSFGILFLIIVALAFLIKLIKQPLIIGYVLAGLLFSFLIVKYPFDSNQIIILSDLGITFLLFLMGLEFDFKSLKYLGKDILVSSILQSLFFFFLAFGITSLFSFNLIEKIYLSILFMFSSTIVGAKSIEAEKETSTLHGKIILGILIIQDIIAIIALTFLSVIQERALSKIILVPLSGLALVIIAFILAKYVLNYLLKIASKYTELLFIFSLGVCFFFVEISFRLGYSTTIGAFIAGVTLANTIYKNDILSRLKSLITFFSMLFFVGIGFQMKLNFESSIFLFIGIIFILNLLIKPIIFYFTLRNRGYDTKTSFVTGIYLTPLSEFSIIITAAGVSSGIIGKEIGSIVIILVILTMLISSYFIKYNKRMYKFFDKYLRKFDKLLFMKEKKLDIQPVNVECNILFFGYYELSKELFSKLESIGKKILVIENDPENINILKKEGVQYLYNSINNPDFFEHTRFDKVEIMVSSLIDVEDNKIIIKQLKKNNPNLIAIVTAKSLKDSLELYNNNADYVIYPAYLNEQHVSVLLEDYTTDVNKVINKKIFDITKFKEKEEKIKSTQETIFDINAFLKKKDR